MGIAGSSIKSKNIRLRFLMIVLLGIGAFGAVLYWRSQALISQEYVEIPTQHKNGHGNTATLRSQNYQIEVQEESPAVK